MGRLNPFSPLQNLCKFIDLLVFCNRGFLVSGKAANPNGFVFLPSNVLGFFNYVIKNQQVQHLAGV